MTKQRMTGCSGFWSGPIFIDNSIQAHYTDYKVIDWIVIEMKNSREIQKEQTRALLIQTAYDIFCNMGIMRARASDIAQAAQVSHGTVFVHFASLDSLIEEVVAVYGQKIALRPHALAHGHAHLAELLRAHLEGIMEFEPFYIRLILENRLLPPGARDSFVGVQSAISFHFAKAMEHDAAYASGIPPCFLFNIWVGLLHHYLSNGDLFAPEGNVIRRHGDMLIKNFLKLVEREGTQYECR
jgi:AcrR family transcriptional regulator